MTIHYNANNKQLMLLIVAIFFFTANLPIFKIGPLSLSFFLGVLLILIVVFYYPRLIKRNYVTNILLAFVVFSLISELAAPISIDGKTFFTCFQIIYWYIIAIIFSNINIIVESKLIIRTILIVLLIIGTLFILFPDEDGLLSENESSFIVIVLWPIVMSYWKNKYSRMLYVLLVVFLLYMIGSRTGILVVLLQLLLSYYVQKVTYINIKKTIVVLLFIIIGISNLKVRTKISETLFPEDPGMQMLIENPDIVFQMDKSWAQRRIQQEKCIQVFRQYPIIGLGPLNVSRYNINININNLSNIDDNILHFELTHSDSRSAHNSYYQLIAENGCVGFILLFFVLYKMTKGVYKYKNVSKANIWVLVSMAGMLANLYMVSALWGTNTWILLGVFCGYANNNKINSLKFTS